MMKMKPEDFSRISVIFQEEMIATLPVIIGVAIGLSTGNLPVGLLTTAGLLILIRRLTLQRIRQRFKTLESDQTSIQKEAETRD